jgi:DNA (cytosine-5)-methyltransferase 3A
LTLIAVSDSHSDTDFILQLPHGKNRGGLHGEKSPTISHNSFEQNNLVIQLNPDKTSAGQQPYQQNRIYDISGKCPALLSEMSCGTHAIKIPRGQRVYDTSGKSVTLSSSDGRWGAGTGLYEEGRRVRRLTPAECARLQTIPEWYVWKCSDTQVYKLCGNGWTIKVITHILSFLQI